MDKFWYLVFRILFKIKAKIIQKQKIYYKNEIVRTCKNFVPPLRVNGPSSVTKNTSLGKNVSFNGMNIRGKGNVTIGDNFHSGVGCKILTDIHNYKGTKLPYDEGIISKDVSIGKNVWLGQGVTILGGITIGDGAIIQAGSVVVKNIPKCAIAGGHPAVVFNYRDLSHYNELESNEYYH